MDVAWSEAERFEFDDGAGVRRTDLTNAPVSAFPLSRDVIGIAKHGKRAAFEALRATRKCAVSMRTTRPGLTRGPQTR